MTKDSFAILLHAIRTHMGQFLSYKISYMKMINKELQSS